MALLRRVQGASAGTPGARSSDTDVSLKARIQSRLLTELDPDLDLTRRAEVRARIEELFNAILAEESIVLSRAERQRLLEGISADILGFGPLEPLLQDGSVSAIFVNGAKNVFVVRGGSLTRANVVFEDEAHLLRVLERMCAPLGVTPTAGTPMIRGTLANGGSFVALLPPLSLGGVSLVVRPPALRPLIMDDLIDQGVLSGAMASILTAAARAGWNLLIAGDGGVRLLLGLLIASAPSGERIIGIGADYGLLAGHPGAAALWNSHTPDEMASAAAFVARAWDAWRADRVVIGALNAHNAAAALDSLLIGTTMIALDCLPDPHKALNAFALMVSAERPGESLAAVRAALLRQLDLIVIVTRLNTGQRRVIGIYEVRHDQPTPLQPLYIFQQVDWQGERAVGTFESPAAPSERLAALLWEGRSE